MKTNIVNFDSTNLIKAIQEGEVVAFPTETVYGLGVIYDQEHAFEKLVDVKKRRPDKPFTLMLASEDQVQLYSQVNEKTKKVISTFMPGEITILVKPMENLYPWVTLNSKYIGLRVSGKKEVCELISKVNKPLLVTSANISSFPACVNFSETKEVFEGKVAYIVEGETFSSIPSTIVICDEELTLVRQGSIAFEDIKKVWEE